MITDPKDPQCYTWHALFSKFTWLQTYERVPRTFVIVQVWHDLETGAYEALELLEINHEQPIKREYQEIWDLFQKGAFKRTSVLPG